MRRIVYLLVIASLAASCAVEGGAAPGSRPPVTAIAAAVRDATGLPVARVPVRPDDIALAT